MRWKLTAILLLLAWFFTGCASFQASDFSEVRLGMDRSDVIDNIGSPLSTQKHGDLNIWTYRLPNENHQVTFREVHFRDDRVVYAGDPVDWPKKSKRAKASEGEPEAVDAPGTSEDFKPIEAATDPKKS